jgi:DNA polymerase-1
MSKTLDEDIKILETSIFETVRKIQLITKQLGMFYSINKNGGVKQKKTKTGQYATGEEILSYLAAENQL